MLGIVADANETADKAVVAVHWTGTRLTGLHVAPTRTGRYSEDAHLVPGDLMFILGGRWKNRQLAATMNHLRCKCVDGRAWIAGWARDLRERFGIAEFNPYAICRETISVDEIIRRPQNGVGSVNRLIPEGMLPA